MIVNPVVFSAIRDAIPNASLLLWRRGRWEPINRIISGGDRTIYCHAGTVEVDDAGSVWSLEMLQWKGGLRYPLWRYVQDYPGRMDVFFPNAGGRFSYKPDLAVAEMRKLISRPYGYGNILHVGLSYVPLVRLLVTPSLDDEANGYCAPHCSMARVIADTAGGVDPVCNTPAYATTPGDLARSLFFKYLYTLYYTTEQVVKCIKRMQ